MWIQFSKDIIFNGVAKLFQQILPMNKCWVFAGKFKIIIVAHLIKVRPKPKNVFLSKHSFASLQETGFVVLDQIDTLSLTFFVSIWGLFFYILEPSRSRVWFWQRKKHKYLKIYCSCYALLERETGYKLKMLSQSNSYCTRDPFLFLRRLQKH